ncbi:MAG: class I SAM-dependent methyltransferase [Gemmatirosa sp.]|nr:class I SAM-dependent methyltransferase [Gemmatirosa sp.]
MSDPSPAAGRAWAPGPAYDRIAERWATARTTLPRALELLLARALEPLLPAAAVLDVGCGSGVPVARWLAARGYRVTGIDASARLLAQARQAVPTATFHCADLRTAAPGGPFDALVAWDVVFHVPRAEHAAVFARFAAWLRPGGRLVLSLGGSAWEGTSEMHGETFFYSGHSPERSLRLLQEAGFEICESAIDDPRSRGHLAIVAQRRLG